IPQDRRGARVLVVEERRRGVKRATERRRSRRLPVRQRHPLLARVAVAQDEPEPAGRHRREALEAAVLAGVAEPAPARPARRTRVLDDAGPVLLQELEVAERHGHADPAAAVLFLVLLGHASTLTFVPEPIAPFSRPASGLRRPSRRPRR